MATTTKTKLFKKQTREIGASDPILTRIAAEDKVPWYRKPNLRFLYLMLFPTCMGIELTSGFDSQLINALQIVPSWIECTFIYLSCGNSPLLMAVSISRLRTSSGLFEGHYCCRLFARRDRLSAIHPLCQSPIWKARIHHDRQSDHDLGGSHSRLRSEWYAIFAWPTPFVILT
jgi:hypothetical protein